MDVAYRLAEQRIVFAQYCLSYTYEQDEDNWNQGDVNRDYPVIKQWSNLSSLLESDLFVLRCVLWNENPQKKKAHFDIPLAQSVINKDRRCNIPHYSKKSDGDKDSCKTHNEALSHLLIAEAMQIAEHL